MKHILITCDTEVGELHANKIDAFEVFIEGKVYKQEVGYRFINNLSSKYGAIVEHFVDIYSYESYGEEKFERLCCDVVQSGHKVALHTHPSSKYDKSRKFMHQYSLDEQIEIIKFGKEKICQWIGQEQISHRAGGYGADDNTLKALKENGIFTDSSFFYKNANCKISYPYKNKPFVHKGVLELPVSVYERQTKYKIFGERNSIIKLDFRYGSSADEILEVIDLMREDCVIVLFLHSFNFLNLPYDFKSNSYGNISVNIHLMSEYEKLLSGIKDREDTIFDYSLNISRYVLMEDQFVKLTKKGKIIKAIKQKIISKLSNKANI